MSHCIAALTWKWWVVISGKPDAQHHGDLRPAACHHSARLRSLGTNGFPGGCGNKHLLAGPRWSLKMGHIFVGFSGCIHSWANVSNCEVRNCRYVT